MLCQTMLHCFSEFVIIFVPLDHAETARQGNGHAYTYHLCITSSQKEYALIAVWLCGVFNQDSPIPSIR